VGVAGSLSDSINQNKAEVSVINLCLWFVSVCGSGAEFISSKKSRARSLKQFSIEVLQGENTSFYLIVSFKIVGGRLYMHRSFFFCLKSYQEYELRMLQ